MCGFRGTSYFNSYLVEFEMKHYLAKTSLLTAAIVFTVVQSNDAQAQMINPMDADQQMAKMAEQHAGFAGAYYDQTGKTVVVMADVNVSEKSRGKIVSAAKTVDNELLSGLQSMGFKMNTSPVQARSSSAEPSISMQIAKYDFAQLYDIKKQAEQLLAMADVHFVDIDETTNKVVIGIDEKMMKASSLSVVKSGLRKNLPNVPADAIEVRTTKPFMTMSLRASYRPLRGGIELGVGGASGNRGTCTLGFPARVNGQLGFFTNSHCTDDLLGPDGAGFSQPLGGGFLGNETIDPNGFPCNGNRECRASDAAFIRTDNVSFGVLRITNTAFNSPTSSSRDFSITGTAVPAVGQQLYKNGRTTGLTAGNVLQTCVTINQSNESGDTFKTITCNSTVAAGVVGGDSGSPVFDRNLRLYGILWGGGGDLFVFSPLSGIAENFGSISVR